MAQLEGEGGGAQAVLLLSLRELLQASVVWTSGSAEKVPALLELGLVDPSLAKCLVCTLVSVFSAVRGM